MSYDKNNIFAKILRGEIPCKKVYENDHVLAFHDINPGGQEVPHLHFHIFAGEKIGKMFS